MSNRSFRSIFMVASCAGAALGCYLVSLRVASERAALEDVESRIVLAQRDIRTLQTEIGTRGRLAQLERWNVKVLALSAPSADQFLNGSFELAKLTRPEPRGIDPEAPMVLASAPAPTSKPRIDGAADDGEVTLIADRGVSAGDLMHTASLKREIMPARPPGLKANPASADKAATQSGANRPAVVLKSLGGGSAKPVAERKAAAADPLAPLPSTKPRAFAIASSKGSAEKP